MKIALDPTPFHHDHELLEFPRLVADLGYENLQLTPHRDFIPFFNHPRAELSRHLASAVGRRPIDHDDLVSNPLAVQYCDEPGDKHPQVFGLVHDR